MKELIERLQAEGLTETQAYKAVEIIKDFAKEKFPIFGGAVSRSRVVNAHGRVTVARRNEAVIW